MLPISSLFPPPQHKRMAMGKPIGKMGGGMMAKGYKKGGAAC